MLEQIAMTEKYKGWLNEVRTKIMMSQNDDIINIREFIIMATGKSLRQIYVACGLFL